VDIEKGRGEEALQTCHSLAKFVHRALFSRRKQAEADDRHQEEGMATCTASSSAAMAAKGLPVMKAQVGLRTAGKVDAVSMRSWGAWEGKTMRARGGAARTRCDALSAPLVISITTGSLLFLGRFVFLPFQRKNVASQGLPVQNGITHFEAGDSRAAEVSSLLQTKDPAGFTLIDVLGWGALGHAIAFSILATASNGYDPQF
ncbi:hypothetical protein GOP47_0020429, partial [Adiantum capillus-veneris]